LIAAVTLAVVGAAGLATVLITRTVLGPPKPDFREALVAEHVPVSLNPLVSGADPAVHDLGELTYRHLLKLDSHAYPVADLANNMTISPDGKAYTLSLPPGLVWSNGRPISAADITATVGYAQSPAEPDHPLAASWKGITVAATGTSGRVVRFGLPLPRASFPALLADLPILPLGGLNATQLSGLATHAADLPTAVSGPYMVTSSGTGLIELAANPHAATPPRLGRIEMRLFTKGADAAAALRAGDVDAMLATGPADAAAAGGGGRKAIAVSTFRFVDLLLNERSAGLADPAVRQAISQAVDRGRLIHAAGGDAVTQAGPFPSAISWVGQTAAPAVAPQAAGATLDAAGWALSGDSRARDGVPLTLKLAVGDVAPLPAVARELAAELGAVGIRVTVTPTPATDFFAKVLAPGAFDLALADWDNGSDPDVSSYWRSSAVPPNGFNVSGAPADPFLDQALDSLATLSDMGQRRQAAAQVTSQLSQDLPAVFLYSPQESYVLSSGFTGVTLPSPGDRFSTIATWAKT
jgi:ABC-type transport system substrate-binding protein